MKHKGKPTVIDLFSGCGGFSLGAYLAGCRILLAVDIDKTLTSSYPLNFPNARIVYKNISELSGNQLMNMARESADLIVGGPPCQGFSPIGKRQKDDNRNDLVHHYFRLILELRPKAFVFENVPGLLDEYNRSILYDSIELISKEYVYLGPVLLDASDYGAPTRRKRAFVIGLCKDNIDKMTINDFTIRSTQKHRSVEDAFIDLPISPTIEEEYESYAWGTYGSDLDGDQKYDYAKEVRSEPPEGLGDVIAIEKLKINKVSGQKLTKHSETVRRRFDEVAPGQRDDISRYPRLKWEEPSPTLRAGTGPERGSFQAMRPIHPSEPRVITVREAARLQGFPDWFLFHPTKWHSFRMIGNSVSPYVARFIIDTLSQKIKED